MELKLNLFVHGVPKGQKIWGPQEDDRIFLESFYTRKSNIEAQLQVDVFQIGGKLNCYYTYIRGGNILDKDNRQGSYFALTVRVNAFYNDLFNMFNILDATYHKSILNNILTSDESSTRFIVEDFLQSKKKIQDIEKEIINYLSSFSISSDFISLDNFATNSKSDSQNINLLECNNKSVLNYIKDKGSISISPFYPSRQLIEFTRKKDEELSNIKLQSQQLIAEEKKKSEQEILILKKEYAAADKTISDLSKQLENERNNSVKLKSELSRKDDQLNKYANLKQKFDIKEEEFIKVNSILANAKQLLNGIDVRKLVHVSNETHRPQQEVKMTRLEKLNKYLPLINLFLALFTVLVVLYSVFKIHSLQNKYIEKMEMYGTSSYENTLDFELQVANETTEKNNADDAISQYKEHSQYQIDIKEFRINDTIMTKGKKYQIQLIPQINSGHWKTNDFTFNKDSTTIEPNRKGNCKIEYVVDEKIMASRLISVR